MFHLLSTVPNGNVLFDTKSIWYIGTLHYKWKFMWNLSDCREEKRDCFDMVCIRDMCNKIEKPPGK